MHRSYVVTKPPEDREVAKNMASDTFSCRIRLSAGFSPYLSVPCITQFSQMFCTVDLPLYLDICYPLTHYKPAAADIPVASDNPAHYADAIRYNARTPLQGSLLPLTRLVWVWYWCSHVFIVFTKLSVIPLLSDSHRRVLRFKSQHPGELACFISPVAWTIIRQPLHWRRRKIVAEAAFHRSQHDVLYCFTVEAAGSDRPVQCLDHSSPARTWHAVSPLSQQNSNPSGTIADCFLSRPLCLYVPVSMAVQQVFAQATAHSGCMIR